MWTFGSRLGGLASWLPARDRDHRFALRVIEHLSVATFALAADRRVLIWNKACEDLTGAPAREIVGTRDHWRAFHAKPRPRLAELVLARRFEDVELRYARGGGQGGVSAEDWCEMPKLGRPLYLAADAAPVYDESGVVIAAVESLRDLTAEKQRQTELESLAALDGLTGLLNRRSFDERLALEARRASRVKHPLALLMIDVDNFKPYNDAYGHQVGDEGLRRVALAIRDALARAGDVAARYGGDEFAVILPDVDRAGALQVAQRIRERVDDLGALCVQVDAPRPLSPLWRGEGGGEGRGGEGRGASMPSVAARPAPHPDLLPAPRGEGTARRSVDPKASCSSVANPVATMAHSLTLSIGGCVAARGFEGSAERLVALADAELYRAKRSGRNRTSIAEFDAGATPFADRSASRRALLRNRRASVETS